jgi:hypothetical protein
MAVYSVFQGHSAGNGLSLPQKVFKACESSPNLAIVQAMAFLCLRKGEQPPTEVRARVLDHECIIHLCATFLDEIVTGPFHLIFQNRQCFHLLFESGRDADNTIGPLR